MMVFLGYTDHKYHLCNLTFNRFPIDFQTDQTKIHV